MLLNLVLLARTAWTFEDALVRAFPEDGEPRENFRMRIENTLFVQLLVGGRLEREGLNAKLLSLMAIISLALAPAALLLMIEIKFLPYHSEAITWLHRGLLALDLALVWTSWPAYRSGWGVRLWPQRSWWLALPGVSSAAALVYAITLATFPDEHMYLATDWLHGSGAGAWLTPVNTLYLSGEDLIDDAKLAHVEENESGIRANTWTATLSLAGRNLTGANLGGADVWHAGFSGAILNRANLEVVRAKQAHFYHAQLRNARLRFARLQGASLDDAQLQGAMHFGTELQGASLVYAQLQGAVLDYAQLQGASLVHAQLQGASLDDAGLQGAWLEGAKLQGASLKNVCAWRVNALRAVWKDTRVVAPKTGAEEQSPDQDRHCNWSVASFEELKRLIGGEIPQYNPLHTEAEEEHYLQSIERRRQDNIERIENTLDSTKTLEGEAEVAKIWAYLALSSPRRKVYEKSLAEIWRKAGCHVDLYSEPYVARALAARLPSKESRIFETDSPEVPKLAAAFLDEEHCEGARGLSNDDKATLKIIRDSAPPPAPKP